MRRFNPIIGWYYKEADYLAALETAVKAKEKYRHSALAWQSNCEERDRQITALTTKNKLAAEMLELWETTPGTITWRKRRKWLEGARKNGK